MPGWMGDQVCEAFLYITVTSLYYIINFFPLFILTGLIIFKMFYSLQF